MITIENNIIPFKGFTAMALWPFVFVRKDSEKYYTDVVERHEYIHGEQQKEMLIVFFLLWYGIEWLIKWACYRNSMTAYKNVSFEREAYRHQNDAAYLDERKHYAWTKYIINN
jgi:hypothetical protein